MIGRIFDFAETTPDAVAIYRHGEQLSFRAFADAIGAARTSFAARGVAGSGIAALIVDDIRDFWIRAFALSTLGLTTIAVRRADELDGLDLPALRFVVDAGGTPSPPVRWSRPGVELVPPPSLRDPPSWPSASEMAGAGHLTFSSGTTGRRKLFRTDLSVDRVGNIPTDASMVYHVFDYGPWTLVGYGMPRTVWNAGGAVLIHQRGGPQNALRDVRGTHATVVPHMLNAMLAAPEGSYPLNERLQLLIGGGAVSWSQVEAARRRITPNVFNAFGSTEVGAIAITPLETPEDLRWHRPKPPRHVEVVDDYDRPVPVGTPGLFRVAYADGPSSYFNDPETTAQFFKDGFFYTGDLAVMREDGRFALRGRVTDVINLHGSKIEPGPCEAMIEETFGLGACCLVSAIDRTGAEKLFIVLEHPRLLEHAVVDRIGDALVRFFGTSLSGGVILVDAMPRTDTGKIIRREVQSMIVGLVDGPGAVAA